MERKNDHQSNLFSLTSLVITTEDVCSRHTENGQRRQKKNFKLKVYPPSTMHIAVSNE